MKTGEGARPPAGPVIGEGAREAAAARQGAHPSALSAAVRERARELGFELVGITTPEPSEHLALYRRWLAEGRHGEMAYLARADAVARRGDLRLTLPGVRSVVVVGHEHYQEDPPGVPGDPSRGVIARYARGRDYHRVVKKKLTALGRWLGGSWCAYVDTGPILERDLGRRAGLGWFGKNTMLIHPRKGSYFFLGVLLSDAALDPDEPFTADFCGSCTACLDACPTGALLGRDPTGAAQLDARRCISYLTIEHRGEIPSELAPLMGNRIFGCDICQEVCPWNRRFAKPARERAYAPREARVTPGTNGPPLGALMEMTEAEWDAFSRGSALRRAGYAGVRRNVEVALRNWRASRPQERGRGRPNHEARASGSETPAH